MLVLVLGPREANDVSPGYLHNSAIDKESRDRGAVFASDQRAFFHPNHNYLTTRPNQTKSLALTLTVYHPSFVIPNHTYTIMIATCYSVHLHMPSRPSPLSERDANAASRPFQFSMATSVPNNTKNWVAPRRAYKPNPVVQTRDAATKQRRDMFFKRVQQGREDKKWDARGEQVRVVL